MLWSIILGTAIIVYALWVLIKHIRGMVRGECSCCPSYGSCDHSCQKES